MVAEQPHVHVERECSLRCPQSDGKDGKVAGVLTVPPARMSKLPDMDRSTICMKCGPAARRTACRHTEGATLSKGRNAESGC